MIESHAGVLAGVSVRFPSRVGFEQTAKLLTHLILLPTVIFSTIRNTHAALVFCGRSPASGLVVKPIEHSPDDQAMTASRMAPAPHVGTSDISAKIVS